MGSRHSNWKIISFDLKNLLLEVMNKDLNPGLQ